MFQVPLPEEYQVRATWELVQPWSMTTCQLRPPVCASSAGKGKRRGLVTTLYEEMNNNEEFK
eukprot:9925234-Lingulodinium_polyedra.AAC.1